MKKLLLLLLLFAQMLSAQVDSLAQALQHAGSDIERADLLNTLADQSRNNPVQMRTYTDQAITLSRKIQYRLAEASAFQNLGNVEIISGNYLLAMRAFDKALSIFSGISAQNPDESRRIKAGKARALGSMGVVFSEQSNYAKALPFYFKALRLYAELNDDSRLSGLYNNIGVAYQSQGELSRALEFFLKCLKVQEAKNDSSAGIILTNIGNVYLAQNNTSQAYNYYLEAGRIFARFPDARGEGELYNNMGLLFAKKGSMAEAFGFYAKAEKAFTAISDQFGIADTYYYKGKLFLQQGNYKEALVQFQQSLALAKSLGITEQVRNAEENISRIYEKTGDAAMALRHYKAFKQASDSLVNIGNIRNSLRDEMNFEFEKKEVSQKKEQEKQLAIFKEAGRRHRQELWFTALLALLVFGIGFLVYNRIQLKKTLTLQKELAEYEQKALHLQMNPHFVFNCLGSISSFIVQNGTDSAIRYLSKFSKLMRLTLEYSKEPLIPIDKEMESLQNYLELEQLRFNHRFDFSITKTERVEDDVALPPLLLQPFVENAIMHGIIPKGVNGLVAITFDVDGKSLLCTISDDGIGFLKSQQLKEKSVVVHKSMALDITRKRLEMMRAITDLPAEVKMEELTENEAVTGTKITLTLPLQYMPVT